MLGSKRATPNIEDLKKVINCMEYVKSHFDLKITFKQSRIDTLNDGFYIQES